ncbi:MAG TPA: hypothetical protein VIJ71_09875, partial [Mycobacteriales bacterium]
MSDTDDLSTTDQTRTDQSTGESAADTPAPRRRRAARRPVTAADPIDESEQLAVAVSDEPPADVEAAAEAKASSRRATKRTPAKTTTAGTKTARKAAAKPAAKSGAKKSGTTTPAPESEADPTGNADAAAPVGHPEGDGDA